MIIKKAELVCRNIFLPYETNKTKFEAIKTIYNSQRPSYHLSKPAFVDIAKFLLDYINEREKTTDDEIIPCPMCAGEGQVVRSSYAVYGADFKRTYNVKCCDCGLVLECNCDTRQKAVREWNHRVFIGSK